MARSDSMEFEARARLAMSEHYHVKWDPYCRDMIKRFDMISSCRTVVGDAKYYTLVNGTSLPPAMLATIAEHVWLLEKTPAEHQFLIFGNQIEVPRIWLKRYGHLCTEVRFYFLDQDGVLETLNS